MAIARAVVRALEAISSFAGAVIGNAGGAIFLLLQIDAGWLGAFGKLLSKAFVLIRNCRFEKSRSSRKAVAER